MNSFRTIYAKAASPAAISAAFAEHARRHPAGLFWPIGQSMIRIPCAVPAGQPRAVVQPRPTPDRQPAPIVTARQRLRAHPYAVGGYACVFDCESPSRGREVVKPGAFARAIAAGGWFLLVDHRASAAHDRAWTSPITSVSPSRVLASMDAGTLHVEEDEVGLWCECCLPLEARGRRLIDQLRRRQIRGLSTGSMSASGALVAGVRVFDRIAVWEISLCIDNPPSRAGTWVALLGVADGRRGSR